MKKESNNDIDFPYDGFAEFVCNEFERDKVVSALNIAEEIYVTDVIYNIVNVERFMIGCL